MTTQIDGNHTAIKSKVIELIDPMPGMSAEAMNEKKGPAWMIRRNVKR